MLQILFFLLVALIHGRSLNQFHRKCGSRDYIPEIDASLEATVAQAIADGTAEDNFQWPITVNVNFHVIMGGNTTDQGNVPDSWITNQIELLNKDYSNTFVNFNLNTITRTLNETWFDEIDYDNEIETAMKQELRQGDSLTLNIYTAKLSGGLLGWATFPTDLADRPWRDGVVVHFNTLPGGKLAPFNLGRTLTHEAGHWFGLWHTFQDSCSYPNDFVSDTPPVKKPNFGCQAPKKSCLVGDFSKPDEQIFFTANDGNSTITDGPSNFMDYGNDACMDFFSTGQYSRMKAIWAIRQFYVEM